MSDYLVKIPDCKISGRVYQPGDVVPASVIGPGAAHMLRAGMLDLYAEPHRIQEETSHDREEDGTESGRKGSPGRGPSR
jgi:hypothetical protein